MEVILQVVRLRVFHAVAAIPVILPQARHLTQVEAVLHTVVAVLAQVVAPVVVEVVHQAVQVVAEDNS